MRAGSLNQSTCTRSLASACLRTHASPDALFTSTVRLETPPASTRTCGDSAGPIRPVALRYKTRSSTRSMSRAPPAAGSREVSWRSPMRPAIMRLDWFSGHHADALPAQVAAHGARHSDVAKLRQERPEQRLGLRVHRFHSQAHPRGLLRQRANAAHLRRHHDLVASAEEADPQLLPLLQV